MDVIGHNGKTDEFVVLAVEMEEGFYDDFGGGGVFEPLWANVWVVEQGIVFSEIMIVVGAEPKLHFVVWPVFFVQPADVLLLLGLYFFDAVFGQCPVEAGGNKKHGVGGLPMGEVAAVPFREWGVWLGVGFFHGLGLVCR